MKLIKSPDKRKSKENVDDAHTETGLSMEHVSAKQTFSSQDNQANKERNNEFGTRSKKFARKAKKKHSSDLDDFSEDFEKKPAAQPRTSPKTEYDRLMHKAVYLLSMREHSVQELKNKLSLKADNPDTVFAVMDYLTQNDYVSDLRFAEAFVRFRSNKGQGPIKIKAELRAKGVGIQVVDEYLDVGAAMWFDNALVQHDKKFGDEPVKDYSAWSKRARFLQSRGFTMDHIQSVVPQITD